jgi:hypothetical protein
MSQRQTQRQCEMCSKEWSDCLSELMIVACPRCKVVGQHMLSERKAELLIQRFAGPTERSRRST